MYNIINHKVLLEENKNNGMVTRFWGPCAWFFLHCITFNFPINPTEEDKINYYNFFFALQYVLPCKSCRINYSNNIKEPDTILTIDTFNNRETVKRWLYNLHNKVNNLTNKQYSYTYTDMNNEYEKYRAMCSNKNDNHMGCVDSKLKEFSNKKCYIIIK
jgi:hypothetical protein